MKDELKTLKDLEKEEHSFYMGDDLVFVSELQAEATKWFKHKGFRLEDGWECFRMFLNLPEELTDDD